MAYNKEHNITPQPIKKDINTSAIVSLYKDAEQIEQNLQEKIRKGWQTADWQKMNAKDLQKAINKKKKEMLQAAKDMDFKTATLLRDEMFQMQDRLQAIE